LMLPPYSIGITFAADCPDEQLLRRQIRPDMF